MASEEERERHSKRRKRNIFDKLYRDNGDRKGAFSLKPKTKKEEYKKQKLNPRSVILLDIEE